MVDAVISIAGKVAELLVVPIGKKLCYPFKYKSNMEELKQQVEKLRNAKERVQHSIDEAKRQGDDIEKDVEKWLSSVDEFAEKIVKPIIDEEDKAKNLCSIGFLPNLMTRYSLAKKAAKTAKDVVDLLREGKFEKVSHRPAIGRTKSFYTRGHEDFGSRMLVFEKIMEALVDEDVNLIGVYGMGGVGKTTLVKRVAAQALEDKLFDVVAMAEVTQTLDIKNIQAQIADELDMAFHKESLSGRASQLRERLKKETSVLLILDNIWEKLDLDAVGIPFWSDEKPSLTQEVDQGGRNANKRKCRLLLTSRDLDVLRTDMNTRKNFLVDILSDVEARNLFWKIVNHSEENPDFSAIAVEIVTKCAGLPVAITTIANALKNRDLSDWKNALQWLRMSNPKPIKGMEASVYSTIELSYNILGAEEQSLFLLCSLDNAGMDIHTLDLFKYSMGLDLFKDVDTVEEARNRMHTLISNLKASCLLLDGTANDFVKMHDIIHAVAISIASSKEELMFNIQNVSKMKEMLEEKQPNDSIGISLHWLEIDELPEILEFPKLELFLLISRDYSLKIPDAFFEGVKGLKVLDLTALKLLALPSSLGMLMNLQTLCLDHCLLGDIAIIGKLKKLEILSCRQADIKLLPREIGQLTRLKVLDLSNCSTLKVITPNVISGLTRLEELYMGNSFVHWDVGGQSNASLAELKKLSKLTTLEIQVLEAQFMPQDLFFGKLERYRIFIGDVWNWSGKYETSKTLKLKLNSCLYLSDGVKFLVNKAEDLYLDKLNGVKNVLHELNGEGFQQLKHLLIQNSPQIRYIINSIEWGLCNVFPRLESLFLHNLVNLEKICHDRLAIESSNKLRIVKVDKCDRLKHLFSFSMVKNLLQLQEIEVTDCKKLEEIVFKESEEQVHQNDMISRVEFTQLHTLTLLCLPRLTSFGFNLFTPDTESQEIVAGDEPEGSMSLFSQNVVLPSLENLKLFSINIGCTWFDQLPVMSSCCQTFKNLTLEKCEGLEFLFSCSMVKSLVQLEKLEIRYCGTIEGIINTEELRGKEKDVFPKLLLLQLQGLPKLAQFSSGKSVEFPSLTQLYIQNCPKLKTFLSDSTTADLILSKDDEEMNYWDDMRPLFDKKVAFPCLKELILSELPELLHLWKEDSQASLVFEKLTSLSVLNCEHLKTLVPSSASLQKLRTLTVWSCNGLMNLMTLSTAKTLVQLESMDICYCKMIEEMIIDMGADVILTAEGEKDAAINKITLFMLNSIELEDLPSLTSFYSGSNTLEFHSLKTIDIRACPKMETFVFPNTKDLSIHSASFFSQAISWCLNLRELIMCGCGNLKYSFQSSMAESFVHLEVLEVSNCKFMEGVIIIQEERKSSTLFPKLNQLKLKGLPALTRFCNFNGNLIELPSLSELEIENCPKMQTFASDSLCADMPAIEEPEKVNTEETIHSFFDEKVAFPCLKVLELYKLP